MNQNWLTQCWNLLIYLLMYVYHCQKTALTDQRSYHSPFEFRRCNISTLLRMPINTFLRRIRWSSDINCALLFSTCGTQWSTKYSCLFKNEQTRHYVKKTFIFLSQRAFVSSPWSIVAVLHYRLSNWIYSPHSGRLWVCLDGRMI